MKQIFLSFNTEYWQVFLLSAIPAFINICIFIYANIYLSPNRTTRIFSLFVLLLAIVQSCEAMIRLSSNAQTAMMWARISTVVYIFISPIGLWFALRFSGLYKKLPFFSLSFFLLFMPAILLELLVAGDLDKYEITSSRQWNWIVNPGRSYVTDAIYIWITVIALIMLVSLWVFYFKEKNDRNKKYQALLLAGGLTLPFIVGSIAEVIFPFFLNINSIPLTTPVITIFSVTSIIAIRKYNMLDYSPRHQWQNIVEAMNEGILILDRHDRIMYVNKKFCEITGYKWDELNNKAAYNLLLDEEEKRNIKKILKEKRGAYSGSFETLIKTKTAEKKWFQISGAPYLDRKGKVIGSIAILTNINNLKETKKILEDNNARLTEAQSIAHLGSWELDFKTGIATWSDEACRIYGLSPENNIQNFETWISFIHPEDLPKVKEEINKSQATLSNSSFNHRIIKRDGTIRYIHSLSKFKFNDEAAPIGLFGICYDITEQHKAQQTIIESEKNIRNFARHLNTTIENERLSLAREIHDELGQYLVGIKLGLSSLKKNLSTNEKVCTKITDMINDIESGQQSLRKIATQLRPGILDTLGLLPSIEWLVTEFGKKTEIKCNLTIQNGIPEKYSPQQAICFFRICQEALTNISKHSQASEITVKVLQTPNNLTLKISDNGKGISNEKLKNPFSMGLLGMRERANQIGADLQMQSKNGEGTTIYLELNTDNHEKISNN